VKEGAECEDRECLRRRRMRKGEKAEMLRGLLSFLEACLHQSWAALKR
jgi:hypothetical protein